MSSNVTEQQPLSWPTILFIAGTTIGAALWPLYAYFYGVTRTEIALAVFYYFATGLSITVGYHRLISHRSFECKPWLKSLFLVFGAASWQGSALTWSADHIRHHGHTDTEKDPYNIKQGFWHAHIGWLFRKAEPSRVPSFLNSDPLVVWQDRYYIAIAVFASFVVPFLIAGIGGLLLAGVVRLVIGHHATWLINSWAHVGNHRPYNDAVSANDNWFLAFFTFGEGFHNYHHSFPHDYRNGVSPFAWDPSKWLVWSLSLVGATYNLKRIESVQRWQVRVRTAMENVAEAHGAKFKHFRRTRDDLERKVTRMKTRLEKTSRRINEFELPKELPSMEELDDLRQRVTAALTDGREHMTAATRRQLAKLRSQLDAFEEYSRMLRELLQHEASLLASHFPQTAS